MPELLPANSLAVILASTSVSKSVTAVCGIAIAVLFAPVIIPLALTATLATVVALPYVAAVTPEKI